MAIHRTCDICKIEINIPGFDPGDHYSVPTVSLNAPSEVNVQIETCVPCLRRVMRALGERFPDATSAFGKALADGMEGLDRLEEKSAEWARRRDNNFKREKKGADTEECEF